MDEPFAVTEGYALEPAWEGMGLVDYTIVPHFRSEHSESAAADTAADWLDEQGLPFRTLRDGETIIVDEPTR